MTWRFADLPVRTKFLVTLGIPVLGLVLLIGKQVDSSMKRRDVLRYISVQSRNIQLLGDMADALQQECASSIAALEGLERTTNRITVRRSATDAAVEKLLDPKLLLDPEVRPDNALNALRGLREGLDAKQLNAAQVEDGYARMSERLVAYIGTVFKQAMDAETNDRLFAHLSLVNAKEALNHVRTSVFRSLGRGADPSPDPGTINEHIGQYESNTVLFQRDAPPDILSYYNGRFHGAQVNMMRSIMGTIHEKRSLDGLGISPVEWWQLSGAAMDGLRAVEERSISSIISASEENSVDAQRRLVIVLLALLCVVGAVGVMAFVIMRGLRNTVEEVTSATEALARGDVRAHVPVSSADEVGQMARTFNGMIDNIRSLAASAEAIGKGNYDTPVPVRGEQDTLGQALSRMRDNLKSARDRDLEYNTALQLEKEKLEQANERIKVLIKEIHHRVKNNLQVVASLLRLQSSTIEDEHLQQVFGQSQSRVASMALIHEKLYKGDDLAHIDLSVYLKELFAELVKLMSVQGTIEYRTRIDPDLTLDLDTMVPLGLVLNELITNSFKHAFAGREKGVIDLVIQRVGPKEFDLIYTDNGIGIPQEKLASDGATLGMSLIDSLVEQMNGFLAVESGPEGTRYQIRFRAK